MENIFGVITSWPDRVGIFLLVGGSGRVGSDHKNAPVDICDVAKTLSFKLSVHLANK